MCPLRIQEVSMARKEKQKRKSSSNVNQQHPPSTNFYIIVGIFYHPQAGILMFRRYNKEKLQLPSIKIDKSSDAKLGWQQIQSEIAALLNMLEKKTSLFFTILATVAVYHFLNDEKTIKSFLLDLSSEYKMVPGNEEPFDHITYLGQIPDIIFISADQEKIKNDERIRPHDKTILLDYLANAKKIQQSTGPHYPIPVKAVKAIA